MSASQKTADLLPPDALALPARDVISRLEAEHGNAVRKALDISDWRDARPRIPSPVRNERASGWIRSVNMVGINVRTVGSFWRVLHYCLTLPPTINSVHLLPIWEPGVVGSLYGMASWEINPEFLDDELAHEVPELNTPDLQLKAVTGILHASGRTVGMDTIPHTDRFSQIVLAQPSHFEWLRREGSSIVDHRENLHEEVEDLILEFLRSEGPAAAPPGSPLDSREAFFGDATPESLRNLALFGKSDDPQGRNRRRSALIRFIHGRGYEPVPATMGSALPRY
jgi:hypothetical protein